jgi:hypothetical protein
MIFTRKKRKLFGVTGETFWLLLSLVCGATSSYQQNWEEDAPASAA